MMGRFIREMRGRSKREARADEMIRAYVDESEPQIREIKTRGAAIERLVANLERDNQTWK